ncbi:MAG: hypothetical protein ABIP85_24460, partial [Chthoniobacteraceae bacterium]
MSPTTPPPDSATASHPAGLASAAGGSLPASAESPLAARHGVAPVTATFRHILIVVFLIFVFGVVQMFSLWGV